MWQITLVVLAVILLGGALYIFANEKGILEAENKKASKKADKKQPKSN